MVVRIALLLALCASASPVLTQPQAETLHLQRIGVYKRSVFFISIYKVELYSLPPGKLVEEFRKHPSARQGSGIDGLAAFMLDSTNHVPISIEIEITTRLKDYSKEKEYYKAALQNGGFPTDGNMLPLKKDANYDDVCLYVKYVVGQDKASQGIYFRQRKKGSKYLFAVDADNQATLTFLPDGDMASALPPLKFARPDVVRGIISTYISQAHCRDDLKDDMPPNLMKGYASRL